MSLQSEGYASLGEGGHTAVWMLLFRLGLLRGKGFLCGSAGKESTCSAGDLGWEDPLEKGQATHSNVLA